MRADTREHAATALTDRALGANGLDIAAGVNRGAAGLRAAEHHLFVLDGDGRIVYATGPSFAHGGVVGRPLETALEHEVRPAALRKCREALRGHPVTVTVESRDRRARWSVAALPVMGQADEVLAATVVFRKASAQGGGPDQTVPVVVDVRRRALLRRIRDARAPLLVVRAPAGYGKSTLLRQWDDDDPRPFAWVRLSDADNDRDLLVSSIASAMVAATLREQGARRRRRIADFDLESILAAAEREPIVLILDDAQNLRSRHAFAVLEHLADRFPHGSQMALSSRREPDLPFGRLIAQGRMVELGAADLAMSSAEGRMVLENAGLRLGDADAERIVRRTEGCPLALRLAVAARENDLARWLRDEFVSSLAPEDAEFLTKVAGLGALNADLCGAVLEQPESGRILRRLACENTLVMPADDTGDWYRVHGLLEELMQRELSRVDPEGMSRIHARASAWWESRGSWREAVRFAHTSGDTDRAAALMIGRIPETVFTSSRSLGDLLDRFDDWQIRSHRGLAVAKAWTMLAASDAYGSATWTAVAEAAPEPTGTQGARDQTQMALHLLRAMRPPDGCEGMRYEASRACELAPSTGPWAGLCSYVAAMAAYVSGENGVSMQHLERARLMAGTLPPALCGLVSAQVALIATETNDRRTEREIVADAAATIAAGGLADEPHLAMIDALAALVHARSGNESAARLRRQTAIQKADAEPGSVPWLTAVLRTVLARTALHLGDGAQARALLDDARMTWRSGLADGAGLRAQLDSMESTLDSFPIAIAEGGGHLTPAELRVLRFLTTHLSFREIGTQLYLSRHTVKTEAISAYRKLGVTSRSDAVARATELGLL